MRFLLRLVRLGPSTAEHQSKRDHGACKLKLHVSLRYEFLTTHSPT
jgi:hypothetical protein